MPTYMFFYKFSFMISLMLSIFVFFFFLIFIINNNIMFFEWEILNLNSCQIIMTILLDWMSLMFMSFVLFISSMIIYYSKEYMMLDNNKIRFIILIIMFIISMMLLIISPNLISILLGWDGLGLISYCLVIYFQNIKSYNSGMITALTNRIGDVMILMGIAWMLNYGSWTFYLYLNFYLNSFNYKYIIMLIVIASMTKSAQIPFSAWLPLAMAAPTPVSALVHSSTLVTAGVYLMIRFNKLINFLITSKLLLLFSIFTMFMSGLSANFEIDLKKIIALSTLSQLGLMMSIICLSFYKLSFYHLLMHALFKALLFLCAGSFIHNLMNFQDIRLSGNFFNQMPLTSMCFNISNLALCGMPFLSGFYSKDLILEMVCFSKLNLMIFILYFISTMLTVSYSFRMIFNISIMSFSSFNFMNIYDECWMMLKPMMSLSMLALMMGSISSWLIFPFLYLLMLPMKLKFLTMNVCLMGMLMGYFMFSIIKFYKNKFMYYFIKMYFSMMWNITMLSTMYLIFYNMKLKILLMKNFNFGWNELYGGYFIMKLFINLTMFYQKFQFNQIKNFFFSYLLMLMMIFILFLKI